MQADGGSYNQLYDLLHQESELQAQIDDILGKKTEIAVMLCAEANMTESSRTKNVKFRIEGFPEVVVVQRQDRTKINDDNVRLSLEAAKMEYEHAIKGIKAEYNTKKKMIEVKAINEGKAAKKPSYYARFEGQGRGYNTEDNETTDE